MATHGYLEKVGLQDILTGRVFMVPTSIPTMFTMEFIANEGWTFFTLEQDLSSVGGGLLIKVVGTTDCDSTLFPRHGGVTLPAAPVLFMAAAYGHGHFTALQTMISEEIEVLELERAAMFTQSARAGTYVPGGTTAGGSTAGGIAAGGSTPGPGTPGGSPTVKNASYHHVWDINMDSRMVSSKEGATTKIRVIAALYREMEEQRRVFLSPDNDCTMPRITEAYYRQSEREPIMGSPLFSISRMRFLTHLEVVTNQDKFRVWLLSTQPSGDFWTSLFDFKGLERTGWGQDNSYIGRANLLEAVQNYGEFQHVFKGSIWRNCMQGITDLWEQPGSKVTSIHNAVLQVFLDNMLRDYGNDIAYTQGKESGSMVGMALGGQAESLALLQAHVAKFVTFIKSGQLEGMPHTAFYGDVSYTRILNKPVWTTDNRRGPVPRDKVVAAGTARPYHKEGLCIWSLAGLLKMKSTTTGKFYQCRTPPGEAAVEHTALSKVSQKTVTKLLNDPKFCGSARPALQAEIKAKVTADGYRFKTE